MRQNLIELQAETHEYINIVKTLIPLYQKQTDRAGIKSKRT